MTFVMSEWASETVYTWKIQDRKIQTFDHIFHLCRAGKKHYTEQNCLNTILNPNELVLLSGMVYEFEDFNAFMCCVTVISSGGGAEKVDDHGHIFWGFSPVLAGLLLIDTFAYWQRKWLIFALNCCGRTPSFKFHTLWESVSPSKEQLSVIIQGLLHLA